MIVLVGFMGAGKSTIGRRLADELAIPFLDSDGEIERRADRRIAEIFASDGEQAFRDIEEVTIADLLTGPAGVLALGGGALGRSKTRARLREHTVVHLHVDFEEALTRVGGDLRRPVLADPALADRYAARQHDYATVATVVVDTGDGRSLTDIVAEVLERIHE